VRAECLDWLLVLNRRHLERVLRDYVDHYNRERPHRALELHRRRPTRDGKAHRWARSAAVTDSAASTTSTTEPPPET
jgi:integrase-like protein